MSSSKGKVTLTMTKQTVTALIGSGSALYGFRAVRSSDRAGRPVVWFRESSYSVQNVLTWQGDESAYTSFTAIKPSNEIVAGFQAKIQVGQTLKVKAGAVGSVFQGGSKSEISIQNTVQKPFTCGLATKAPNAKEATPYCAFPLNGLHLETIQPLQSVLLYFSTATSPPGTVIGRTSPALAWGARAQAAIGPGILIDLSNDNARSVQYDLNAGWSWNGGSWAQDVPAGADLVPLLIDSSQ